MTSQVAATVTDSQHNTTRLSSTIHSEAASKQTNSFGSRRDILEDEEGATSVDKRRRTLDQNQQANSEDNENSAGSWSLRRVADQRLRVVLPSDQKSLVTPNIITTGDSAVATPTQLYNSLVQFNGQEVSLFTGLPSCTPTSADALAATGALHGVNPFFWGVTAFNGQQQEQQSNQQQQQPVPKSNQNKISIDKGGDEPNESNETVEKEADRRHRLSKLSLDQLQTPNNDGLQLILSPLSLLLSPEQEAWIRYGLNQHPLSGQQAPSQLPEVDFSKLATNQHQVAYGQSVEEATLAYHQHQNQQQQQQQQQQQHVYAQDLTNQIAAHQRHLANANAFTSMHPRSPGNLLARLPPNTTSQEGNTVPQVTQSSSGESSSDPRGVQDSTRDARIISDNNKQISNQASIPSHSQASFLLNHQTQPKNVFPEQNVSAQNPFRNQQQQQQQRLAQMTIDGHNSSSENGNRNSSTILASINNNNTSVTSHRGQNQTISTVHPPPVAHHNQQQNPQVHHPAQQTTYFMMNKSAQVDPKLVPEHYHQQPQNQGATSRPGQTIALHYDNGQQIGLYNQQLRQFYLVQQQHQAQAQHQQTIYRPVHQQQIYHQSPLTSHQFRPLEQHQQSRYPATIQQPKSSLIENEESRNGDGKLSESNLSFSSNDNLHIKESFSTSNSQLGDSTSPRRPEISTNPSSERSSVSRDTINVDVTVTAVSSPSNQTQPPTTTELRTEHSKMVQIKRIVLPESKAPISRDSDGVINKIVKKSKGGRKKKPITYEELMARKNRSKERNRVAAKRCRQKRKQFLDELNDRIDNLSDMNKKLQRENTVLKDELDSLKKHHKSCKV